MYLKEFLSLIFIFITCLSTENQTTKKCTYNICENGGKCRVDDMGQMYCICKENFIGDHCETKANCSQLSCLNNGTCNIRQDDYFSIIIDSVYYNTNEYCNCSTPYVGIQCGLKNELPNFIWTPDEQCQLRFGDDYVSSFSRFSNNNYDHYMCTFLQCYSSSDPYFYSSFIPANGTICGPGALCINQQCVNITNAPKTVLLDRSIDGLSCSSYLNYKSATFAKSFCESANTQSRCPITCKKYKLLQCEDTLAECGALLNLCNFTYLDTDRLVKDMCPFTCNTCTPLNCDADRTMCLNGGTCSNVKAARDPKFAFKCSCPEGYSGEFCELKNPCLPNPCKEGKKCHKLGLFSYMCTKEK